MSRRVLVAVVVAALVVPASAAAHVGATPPFLAAGSSDTVHFDVPNELNEPMTGFSVTVPAGFEIEHAHPVEGWNSSFSASTATWKGGALAAGVSVTFGVELRAPSAPDVVELGVVQRYGSSGVVRWPVAFTVTPAAEGDSQSLALAAVIAVLGVLVVATIWAIAWRRRPRSLQEK
jgi:uncharacterized protein YcnI